MGSLNPSGCFPIRWKKHTKQVKSVFLSLRNDQEFTDVTFLCNAGQGSENLQQFPAHRAILAANSGILRTLIKGMGKSDPTIYLHGVQAKLFQYIMDFVYFGEIILKDKDELADLMKLALDLDITGLKENDRNGEFEFDYEVPEKKFKFGLGQITGNFTDLTKSQWTMEEKDDVDETDEDQNTDGPVLKPKKIISIESHYHGITKRGEGWQCLECGKMFSRKDNANRHLNFIHRAKNNPEAQCHICQKVCKNIQSLKEHMRKVHKIFHGRQKTKKASLDIDDKNSKKSNKRRSSKDPIEMKNSAEEPSVKS